MYESTDKMVSHPKHYQSKSGLEVIDVIAAFTEGLEGIEAADTANIIKYACRWKCKNGIQDLEKIMWYTQHLIEHLKSKQEEELTNETESVLVDGCIDDFIEDFHELIGLSHKDKDKESDIEINDANITFYEPISGRYFKSDLDMINKAEKILNSKLMNEMYCSIDDFYDLIGLPHIDKRFEVGWNINDGLVAIGFDTLILENDEPCIRLQYSIPPRGIYQTYMG